MVVFRGFSTLEILIACAVLTLSLSAVIIVQFGTQSAAVDTQLHDEMLAVASAQLEEARATSRADFNLVNATSTAQMSGPVAYTKSLAVAQVGLFAKQATSTVTWQSAGQTFSVMLATLLTSPQAAQGSATTCSSVVTGDWKHPQYHEWDMGALGVNGGDGSGFGISNVAVFNKRIYLTMYTASTSDSDTLFIFDAAADPSQPPVFRGSVDNDPSSTVGPNAIAIASTTNKVYAYLASPSSFAKGQLQVVDVTDPTKPTVVKTFKIPAAVVPAAGAPGSIFYKDGYVYLGLAKVTGGGYEFNIIDVGGGVGSPTNPVWRGGYSAGNAINDIYVENNYAYLATAGSENLTVLDVSNPGSPQRVGGYTPATAPGSNGVGSNHGETVMAVGNTAYLGRTYGTNEFYVLNASDPTNLSVVGKQDIGTGNQPTIYGLVIRDYLAFLMTNTQFQVWNIANPASIVPWTADGTTNTFLSLATFGGTATALDCENNTFYMALASPTATPKDLLVVISPSP